MGTDDKPRGFRCSDQVWREAQVLTALDGTTVSQLVASLLEDYNNSHPKIMEVRRMIEQERT